MSGVSDILARAAQRLDRAAAVKNTLNGKEGSASLMGGLGLGYQFSVCTFGGTITMGPCCRGCHILIDSGLTGVYAIDFDLTGVVVK